MRLDAASAIVVGWSHAGVGTEGGDVATMRHFGLFGGTATMSSRHTRALPLFCATGSTSPGPMMAKPYTLELLERQPLARVAYRTRGIHRT